MNKPILCAGRLYCDLIFANVPRLPTLGTEVFAPGLSLHAGGGAFNSAAVFAGLGHNAAQLSCLPAAPFDTIVQTDMAQHGVDASHCTTAESGTDPQITVAIGANGDRAFLTRAAGPALPDPAHVTFSDFAHLHIGELRTLQDTPTLIDHARAAGLTISLDCAWQDTFDPAVAALIAKVDIFLPNASEEAALKSIGVPEDCAPLTVVKCGQNGARALTKGHEWTHNTIASPVTVRDATGAGDAFNAGFLSKWLKHAPLTDCIALGNACGAATVQIVGGIGFP